MEGRLAGGRPGTGFGCNLPVPGGRGLNASCSARPGVMRALVAGGVAGWLLPGPDLYFPASLVTSKRPSGSS